MRQPIWNTQKPWHQDRQGHQTGHAQTIFIRREDPHRAGRAAWRG